MGWRGSERDVVRRRVGWRGSERDGVRRERVGWRGSEREGIHRPLCLKVIVHPSYILRPIVVILERLIFGIGIMLYSRFGGEV